MVSTATRFLVSSLQAARLGNVWLVCLPPLTGLWSWIVFWWLWYLASNISRWCSFACCSWFQSPVKRATTWLLRRLVFLPISEWGALDTLLPIDNFSPSFSLVLVQSLFSDSYFFLAFSFGYPCLFYFSFSNKSHWCLFFLGGGDSSVPLSSSGQFLCVDAMWRCLSSFLVFFSPFPPSPSASLVSASLSTACFPSPFLLACSCIGLPSFYHYQPFIYHIDNLTKMTYQKKKTPILLVPAFRLSDFQNTDRLVASKNVSGMVQIHLSSPLMIWSQTYRSIDWRVSNLKPAYILNQHQVKWPCKNQHACASLSFEWCLPTTLILIEHILKFDEDQR